MKTIPLQFDGYWREVNKSSVPAESGIYCVYSCKYNEDEKNVSIKKLLYIGESSDVCKRISNHNRLDNWKRKLSTDETLCYSFASIGQTDRERAEAALIFNHQPPTNEEHMKQFIYEDTEIKLTGKTALLNKDFLVKKG